ncbi:hypothetical protein D1BOALGB6SA_10582 [Olavius sp. associated proteobacterium Delta 1]|nr:hypothetical protein D1BOALGB6SA_10582 [Olavius sp. associated proteobacterium Delta 1]
MSGKAVRRGSENAPRDVARYLIRSMRSESLMRVGAGFGLNQYIWRMLCGKSIKPNRYWLQEVQAIWLPG